MNPAQPLIDLVARHDCLIGIDSDGCVFDTMELKHKECFIPRIIQHFGLQPVAKFAREAAEFVNLYSQWRGANRFPALIKSLELLAERTEVKARAFEVPQLPATRAWLAYEKKPANPALAEAVEAAGGAAREELARLLAWSRAVNESISAIVYGVPPFPHARESLQQAGDHADLVVVSATPHEALAREWREHGLEDLVAVIAGQEMGGKQEHLRLAAAGRYRPERVLMIGDAPGDLRAAKANGAAFFPICPGAEAESWRRFRGEALDRFLAGTYAGAYEDARIAEFEALLPDKPAWPTLA